MTTSNRISTSKLVLGTVQLGMRYGLANTTGQPPKEEAFKILDAAFEGGINALDTATAYGSAEELLGEWIEERKLSERVQVISKLSGDGSGDIRTGIELSLKRLHIEQLDGCLLHTPQHMDDKDVVSELQRAKQDGLIAHIGISVYDEADALHALDVGMEYIQVPYNAFDQRLDKTDFFDRAAAASAVVFARSPFLQGLLLMNPNELPEHLAPARGQLEQFIQTSKRYGFSPLEAALLFALGSRAEHVVFGAESKAQVVDILSIAERKTMPVDLASEIRESFEDVERSVIDPRLWNQEN